MGMLLSSQHQLYRRACIDSKKINIRDIPSTEIPRVRNLIHLTVMLYFHLELMRKSVTLNILGLKMVKLDYIII